MADIEPHIIPSIYLANYLNDFEDVILNYEVQKTQIRKGSYLTQYGVINNTAYYIKNGIVHLSLGHEQGKKSLNMFGPGTIFVRIVILSDICSLTVSIRHLNHVWPEFAISYTTILQKSTRSLRKSRCRSQNLPALRERPLPRWSARFGS